MSHAPFAELSRFDGEQQAFLATEFEEFHFFAKYLLKARGQIEELDCYNVVRLWVIAHENFIANFFGNGFLCALGKR